MTQYAHYDSTVASPSPVLGWYDTALLKYPNLPSSKDLLEINAAQWEARMNNDWAVSNGTIVPYSRLTPALIALACYQSAIDAGVSITSISDPSINGVYPLTDAALTRLAAEQSYVKQHHEFSSGGSSIVWFDMSNKTHLMSNTDTFLAFAVAICGYDNALKNALHATADGFNWVAPPLPAALP